VALVSKNFDVSQQTLSTILGDLSFLPKVEFSVREIDKHVGVLRNTNDSILSFGIDILNDVLASLVPNESYVLEVGCGKRSYFRDICDKSINWFGLDVYDLDYRGEPSIATHVGSVHDMPFDSQSFNFVLANQSLEHWFEYGVSIEDGLAEIARVLKPHGEAWLNFPLFLHADSRFLRGELYEIMKEIPSDLFDKIEVEFLVSEKTDNYKGWRKCGFPDFMVSSKTSLNINLILKRNKVQSISRNNKKKSAKRISVFSRLSSYGMRFLLWKIIMRPFGLDRRIGS
jgi:SAM-dependent methyltransferase